jgi:hypothetical protein
MAPALYAVLEAKATDEQVQHLLVALAGVLRSLRDDDRTFSAAAELIWTAVERAVDRVDDEATRAFLLDAFREYVVHHLTADRCAPPGMTREAYLRDLGTSTVLADIIRVLAAHDRAPLTAHELTPIRLTETPIPKRGDPSPAARTVNAALDTFRRESVGQPPAVVPDALEDPSTSDFREHIARVREAMARWTARDEPSEADYFNFRRGALLQWIGLLRPGADRDQALGELIALMKSESIDRFSHVEWFFPVRNLINGYKGSERDRAWMLKALLDSGDPVLRAYAQVEELVGAGG